MTTACKMCTVMIASRVSFARPTSASLDSHRSSRKTLPSFRSPWIVLFACTYSIVAATPKSAFDHSVGPKSGLLPYSSQPANASLSVPWHEFCDNHLHASFLYSHTQQQIPNNCFPGNLKPRHLTMPGQPKRRGIVTSRKNDFWSQKASEQQAHQYFCPSPCKSH